MQQTLTIRNVSIAVILAVLLLAATVSAWTSPPASPPNNNVPAPINVGTNDQEKTGGMLTVLDLWVNGGLGVTGGIYSAGNVGIGVTNTAHKLEIHDEAGSPVKIYTAITPASNVIRLFAAKGDLANPATVSLGDNIGAIAMRGYNGTKFVRGARIMAVPTQTWSSTANAAALVFETAPSTPNPPDCIELTDTSACSIERMRITSTGNVGMGTSVPDSALEVVNTVFGVSHGITNTQYSTSPNAAQLNLNKARGTQNAPLVVQSGDIIGNIRAKGWNGSAFDLGALIHFIAEETFSSSANGTGIIFNTTAPGTDGGSLPPERMRITGSGNVGIGTAAPVAKLDVNGYMRLAPQSSQPIACDAPHRGSIAVTNTGTRICVCTATGWRFSHNNNVCAW